MPARKDGDARARKRPAWVLGAGVAVLLAFLAGRVVAATVILNTSGAAAGPGVHVRLEGAKFSQAGARRIEFSGGPVVLSQVCDEACDDLAMTYDDFGRGGAHLRVSDHANHCVDCGGIFPGERSELRRGPALESQATRK